MTPEKREELRRWAEKATQINSGKKWLDRIIDDDFNAYDEAFIEAATPPAVLDLLTQLDDALFTVKEMERNREESINVTTRREYELTKERDALKAEVERLHEFASDFAEVAEAAVRHHELRVAGRQGQEVPFHGAFSNLPPSSVADLRKFAQAARRVLTQAGGGD